MVPMIRAASLRGFVPLVERLGGEADALLARFGLARQALDSDEALIPITANDLVLDAAAAELGCPDLGLRLAEAQDLSILGPLAGVIESSSTVAEALALASRYMFVHSPALSVGVQADPRGSRGVVALTYRKDLHESPYSPQAIELGLGLFYQVAVMLVGSRTGLRSVEVPHQPLSPVSRYTEFFGADVTFGCRAAALRVERHLLDERFATADEAIRRLAVDYLASHYPDPARKVSTLPLISMINRMITVQYDDWNGAPRTLVFEPTVPDGSAQAPFYQNLRKFMDKVPGGDLIGKAVLKYYNEPGDVLTKLGLSADDIDFCTFDHLHVQDPRMILGSTEAIEGENTPRRPLFGDARMLVHSRELATLQSLHPMQWAWYIDGGLGGVDPAKFVTFDGDIELGPGLTLLWTPGHTDGNHSLVINTPDGVWVSSENGISLDNWQPELSKIPGVRKYHERFGREICPNANTLEDSLDQYDSMVKEKTLADPGKRDPRRLQILPSTELAPWKRFWPVVPTHVHGGIGYGEIKAGLR